MERYYEQVQGTNHVEGHAKNRAGFPVLVGDINWTWNNMLMFYGDRLQRSYVCEQARPIADEQKLAKKIRGARSHKHLANCEARSPITLMLTHYHQHLKWGTGNTCHLTGLKMVAEISHPLKISL